MTRWQKKLHSNGTIDEELGWAATAGYNGVRVFLQYLVWKNDAAEVENKIKACQAFDRPLVCTEWLLRQGGNTFANILPLFSKYNVGWYHWGLVAGRTQTYLHWGSKPGTPMPAVWQHDTFHENGMPYDAKEMEMLRSFNLGK